tara:strand:+ start:3389 stop:3583 length:195 start_codon:yes stop_codon:yes gene_type:complete
MGLMRYSLKRDSGGFQMGMEVATLSEAIEMACLALNEGDDVTLEDTGTGKLWTEAEILKLAQGA